jgi:heptosyltransferase-2
VSTSKPTTESLVIAPQWIGDAVMTEPLLRRLQARGERVTVGALPWIAPVYRAMPQVAEVIEFPFQHGGLQWRERRSMASALRGRFQRAYVLPNSIKSSLIPWLADIPERVGYHGESRYGLLTRRWPNPPRDARPPMVGFYSSLSDAPAADLATDRPQLRLSAADTDAALAALAALPGGLQRGGFHVFATGAEYGPAKRWPTEHWAALARQLAHPVLLLGSAKESAGCEDIAQQANDAGHLPRAINLAGQTPLAHAFALIAAARSLVTNDSGLMHVAAALDVPQVAIFGSSSPEHTPPLSANAQVIWLKRDPTYTPALDCAPCFGRNCHLPPGPLHLRCLRDVLPNSVLQRLPV